VNFAHRAIGALALASLSFASSATVVMSTSSMAGNFSITGFADSTPGTFSAAYSGLTGSVNLTALANGHYTVSAQGAASFVAFPGPGGTFALNVPTATPLFTGFLGSAGLTPGSYSFSFGSALPFAVPFAFDINYDGNASPAVMSALALLGFPFVNPDGAGTLSVSGTFGADGTSASLDFTESNLSWAGFGRTLKLADERFGASSNNLIDGSFALRDVSITATPVSAPTSLALAGLALLLAGVSARRRRA
jgi:hypothetical protein